MLHRLILKVSFSFVLLGVLAQWSKTFLGAIMPPTYPMSNRVNQLIIYYPAVNRNSRGPVKNLVKSGLTALFPITFKKNYKAPCLVRGNFQERRLKCLV